MFKRGGSGEGNSNPGAVATARKASQSLSFSQHLLRGWSIDLCTVGWPLNQPLIFWQKVRSFFTFCKIKTNWRQQDPLAAKVYFPASFFLNNKRERGIITQEMKRRNLVPTSTTVFTVHIRPYLLWLKEYKRNRSGLLWNSDVIVGIPYLSPVWTYSSDIPTLDKAAALPITAATCLTDLRQYINSNLAYSGLKFFVLCTN